MLASILGAFGATKKNDEEKVDSPEEKLNKLQEELLKTQVGFFRFLFYCDR